MSTQVKNLHSDKGKGKSSERMQQAVDELEYLVTFNRLILTSHGKDNAGLI